MFRGFTSVVFALAVACPLAWGQVDTGTVSGTVKDSSGGVIPHAAIVVTNVATAVSEPAQANDTGYFSVPALRPGVYEITAAAPGFEKVNKTGIEVRVQDHLEINFQLPVGQTTSEVSVEAKTQTLNTETSSTGEVVDQEQVLGLPLNGRDYIQLATLTEGTTPSQRSTERDTFVSNGARPIQNSYMLDGIDNKNKIVGFDSSSAQSIEVNVDAVQEFKVQTSNYSAEFGQSAGAIVNVSIKSGTNGIHGSLFEFLRNNFFDARPYFQPPAGATPKFIQNQFGATLGGPIIKNRTFFFFGWQSSREVNAAPQLANVPTLAEDQGIFPGPIYNPLTTAPNPNGSGYTRMPFANNTIPASLWDPVAAKLLTLYPAPNLTGKNNFFSNQEESIDNDQFLGRIDHRFSDRDNVFGRYVTSANTNFEPATLPPPASSPSIVYPFAHSFAASETHIFKPNLINEARIGYQETQEIQQADTTRLFSQYGIIGAPNLPNVYGLPTFAISGLTTLGTTGPGALPTPATGSGNLPIDKEGRVLQADDNLSWVRGRHTIKFGVDFQQVTLYANVTLEARPAYTFNGVYTQNPQSRAGTGSAFADFLLGETSSAQVSTNSISNSRQHIYQGYVQDDWQVNSRLTLNLGVRYELPMPFFELTNNYADAILEPGPYYGKLLDAHNLAGTGYSNSFVDANYHNFAPRVGYAYKLTNKTVIRSAFGVFYGRDENVPVARRPTNNPPYFILTTYTSDQIDPNIILSQGFPSTALNPATVVDPTVNTYLKHSPTPYTQQWNFNIQQDVGAGFVAQVGYIGSSAHDLYFPVQIDTPTPGPGSIQARRPLPQYSGDYEYGPFVSSNYNALQAQLERRFSKGLEVLAAYTWSHSIDNGSSQADNDSFTPLDPFNLALDRGNSNFDVRQRFVLSSVYELPFGKGKPFFSNNRFAGAVLGGWQVTDIFSAQTGLPFTPVLAVDNTNTGTVAVPNRIANGALPSNERGPQNWFDEADFVTPAQYVYGNSGRNILRGPGFRNMDVGISRFFALGERFNLEFRAEAFNIFNTPELGLPNATLGQATTGTITTVVNPQRELQLALRLRF
ncbi:TonB-dependent receptor [Nevskia soli]|uniref:TonB-dependent receptor n=1 Tax=Nevskia soli TaxID=418856 RepID=UPI0015D93D20|nr:carboxypeptidase-like regulatory domain-containing protein [Nevskia soli]